MAKSKEKMIEVSRNGTKTQFSKATWDSMKKSKSTYGWVEKSELDEEILNKDSEIESEALKSLQSKHDELLKENESLVSESKDKDSEIESLKASNSEIQAKHEELLESQFANKGQEKSQPKTKK